MTYVEQVTALTAAAARLLTAPPEHRLPEHDAATALAARDLVVRQLAEATTALTTRPGATHSGAEGVGGPGLEVASLLTSPAHPLREALHALPPTLTDPPGLPALLADAQRAATGWTRDWAEAARAATGLEAYHAGLRELPGHAAWTALRDLAEVASTLPHLDRDLATALPASHIQQAGALTEPVNHGLLRLATSELRTQLRGLPHDPEQLRALDPPPTAPAPLRSPADLPAGMGRLTATLTQVGEQIAIPDVQQVTRLLARGLQLTADQTRSHPQLRSLTPLLTGVADELESTWTHRLHTTSPPDPRIPLLVGEVNRQLTTAEQNRDLPALLGWLTTTGPASGALSHALHTAGQASRILTRPGDDAIGHGAKLLWIAVGKNTAHQHPTLTALSETTDALTTAGSTAARHLHRTPTPTATAATAGAGNDPVRAAAGRAATAAAELRTALAARTTTHPLPAPRPAHPASTPPPGLHGGRRA